MLFRFFFIYLVLFMMPWTWLNSVPGIVKVTQWTNTVSDWIVERFNAWFFHVRAELVPMNGSGDTSFGWAQLWTVLSISFAGMIIWSVADASRRSYARLNYWLCLFVRYYLIMVLFSYGIIKLFRMQMVFPNPSQLATPLGDFLPMRFSWLFIGYSEPYQFFSGLMEVIAALLLLYRRTATLGVIVATGVFLNVAVLNMSYDIPVKIFSMQMVLCCFFLLANEMDRILCFFVYNRPAEACSLYHYRFTTRAMKITRCVLKVIFIVVSVGLVIYEVYGWRKEYMSDTKDMVFRAALYDVVYYSVTNDSGAVSQPDSMLWKNVAFDARDYGTIATADTTFRKNYGRAAFVYKTDTLEKTFKLFVRRSDTIPLAHFHYMFDPDGSIHFNGRRSADSVRFTLRLSPHHYPLADRQFHWLSERNR